MKRLVSLFLTTLIVISLLSIVPTSAENGAGLWYDKLGDNVKITVKGIENASAILLVGKYQNKKMVSSANYPITNHNGTYTLQNVAMDMGFEYRFFVWEGISNVKPLFDCLSLSTETADGVGSTEDNGVKSVTIRENLHTGWYSSGVYSYYPSDEALKPSEYELVTSGLTVVYNNAVITDRDIQSAFGSLDDLVQQADVLTLIGYGTAPYSEIHITNYTYKVVKSVFAEDGVIITQDGYLDLDGAMGGYANFTYNLYDAVGNKIEISDIKEYDVLNIVIPCNEDIDTADHLDIFVTRKVVEGKVTEQTGNEYVISDKKYFAETEISVTDEGKFFLTIDGKIAWKYLDIDIGELGLITEIKSETEETSTRYTLTLFTEEGFIDIPVAESLYLENSFGEFKGYKAENNGQDVLFGEGSDFANALADSETEYEAQEKINKKFIAYRLNSNGEIREIDIANTILEEPFYSEMMEKGVYDAEENTFAGMDIKDSLLIFAPLVKSDAGWNVDISELSVSEFSDLKDKSTHTRYNGISFVKSDNYREELCALLVTEEMIDVNINPESTHIENMSVVGSKGSRLDADDNVVSSITVVQNGERKSLMETYSEKAVEVSGLDVGDIFFYETDENGDIIEVKLIYDASSRQLSDYAQSINIDNNNTAFVFGTVVQCDDRIAIASKVDEKNGNAVMFARFQVHPDLMSVSKNCAQYDENLARNSLKSISTLNIKETVKENRVYAIVARLDEYKRICDIVQIVLSWAEFNEWSDINNINNWKLTY